MNGLITVPKNGSLASKNLKRLSSFPTLTSFMDDWFDGEIPSLLSSNFNTGMTLPQTNIRETADAYYVDMAVPGMKKTDFDINLENQVLSISAELKEENEEVNDDYTRREFGYSSFKRSFNLPETIEESKIKAKYNDGILNVELPKKEEAKQKPPKTIKVL